MDLITNNETKQSRGWCYTINNPTEDDENFAYNLSWGATYTVAGLEIAPTTGTVHIQGYVYFATLKSLKQMKELHEKAHWEYQRGTCAQAADYCKKDGDYFEWGTPPLTQQEKGNKEIERWDLALKCAKTGDFDSIPSDIYLKYVRNIKMIYAENQVVPEQLTGELVNVWYWGEPGSGKSSKAFTENPGAYIKGANKWWDGYTGQDAVIVDDMDIYLKSLAREFKMWGQHQPFAAEIKGGSVCIRPKKIIVTSNYTIDQIWEDETTREAMHRRYTEIYIPSNKPIYDNKLN